MIYFMTQDNYFKINTFLQMCLSLFLQLYLTHGYEVVSGMVKRDGW